MDIITSVPYWIWWIVAIEALALAMFVASFGEDDEDDKQRKNYRR